MCNDNTAQRDFEREIYKQCDREDSIKNGNFYRCKCGAEEEIYEDIEWHVCRLCKRRGCWMKMEQE